ncbi:MAG: hypothetical protein Q4B40_03195, partial [Clostridia bacterium]|nr:hypothetical protein [Clostridia bacterium]
MKNIIKFLFTLTLALITVVGCSVLTANAEAFNKFEISTGDPYNGISASATQVSLDVKFEVNQEYGFVGGDFSLELADELNDIASIEATSVTALGGGSLNANLVETAIKDNTVRFIVNDAKTSCEAITFKVKLNIVSSLTVGQIYKVSIKVADGAFKDDHAANDEIEFYDGSLSLDIHIHSIVHVDAKDPTYTDFGYNEHDRCEHCDYKINYQEIPALEHSIVQVAAKAPQGCQDGNIAHEKCTKCGMVFVDKQEKTLDDVIILGNHEFESFDDSPETCTQDGVKKHKKCTLCQKFYIGNVNVQREDVIIPALGHDNESFAKVPETCETDGVKAYDHCRRCEKFFIGEEEVDEESLIIPALGHDNESFAEIPATCENTGVKAYDHCTRCDKLFFGEYEVVEEFLIIPSLGHKIEHETAKEPTCIEDGYIECDLCVRCGQIFLDGVKVNTADVILPATGIHTLEAYPYSGVEPTCVDYGIKEFHTCTVCDRVFFEGKEILTLEELEAAVLILPTGHNFINKSYQGPTCTEIGWQEHLYCDRCQKCFAPDDDDIYSKTYGNPEIAALGHTTNPVAAKEPQGCDDGNIAHDQCARCGSVFIGGEEKTIADVTILGSHDFENVAEIPSSCTQDGQKAHQVCKFCDNLYLDGARVEKADLIIPAAHTIESVTETPALPGIAGVKAHDKCTVCGKTFINGQETTDIIIPALPVGWQQSAKGWWYINQDGSYAVGWKQIKSVWYYFDADGWMQTGWQKIKSTWYYFDADGVMQTGWVKVSGKWYYMNTSGAMQTGWQKIKNVWYYFEKSGA